MEKFLKQIEIAAASGGFYASIDKGGENQVISFGATEPIALMNLLTEMHNVLSNSNAIPDGWVGGRPDNR